MNFYGDGSDSDVDIVRTESQLRNGRQKAQTRYEADFLGGLLGKCFLLGDGFLVEFAIRRLSPAPCNMRKMRELATFFLTQSAHSQDHRFTAGPNVDASIAEIIGDGHTIDAQPFGYGKYRFPFFIHPDYQRDIDFNFVPTKNDTAFLESPPNNLVIDSERSSNFVGALSSSVSPDNIIQLFRREVNSLHVYTFQTASGIYNAGGIVASNCRCHVIPYVERFS